MTLVQFILACFYLQTIFSGGNSSGGKLSGVVKVGSTNSGGALTVTVSGTTPTQAILSYTSPGGACLVESSESNTYSPLDHDVDITLFTGSNSDSRSRSANNGLARKFVLGARVSELANDGVTIYSRSLQANTLHYVRVNCSGTIGTTTFTTNELPVGSTWNETPQTTDLTTNFLGWMLPTLDGTRTQKINDPFTGIQVSPVSLPPDQVGGSSGSNGIMLFDGAQQRVCGPVNITDPITAAAGALCNFSNQVGWNSAFFIVPSLGISRILGLVNPPSTSNGFSFIPFLNLDLTVFSQPGHHDMPVDDSIYVQSYTGNYAPGSGGIAGSIPLTSPPVLVSVPPAGELLMNNFDPTFTMGGLYSCQTPGAPAGGYAFMKCARGEQDSYGWIGLFYGGDGRPIPSSCMVGDALCPRIVAAWNTYKIGVSKFCGLHQTLEVPNQTQISVNWHGLDTNNVNNFNPGTAAVYSLITTGSSAGAFVIHTNGAPTSQATGGDPESTQTYEAGDRLRINGSNPDNVVASRSGNDITLVNALSNPTVTGQQVQATCNVPNGTDGVWALTWWKPLDNPSGNDMTSTFVVNTTQISGGGHFDMGPAGIISEAGGGYETLASVGGDIWNSLHNPAVLISVSAQFNGNGSPCFGAMCNKHPSYHQLVVAPRSTYYLDRPILQGGDPSSPSGGRWLSALVGLSSAITGTLYEYFPDSSVPLHRKLNHTMAITGGYSITDVSGPTTGNVIGGTVGDNYKYCVAYKVNECRTGSTVGQVFVNIPTFTQNYCSNVQNPFNTDICIYDIQAYEGGILQGFFGTDSTNAWANSRILGKGLAGPRNAVVFPLAKALQDDSYALFTYGFANSSPLYGQVDVWKAKMGPLPATDGIVRSGYISTPVVISAGSQNNAIVKFWYTEYKDPAGNLHCGSRGDDCYAVSNTIPVDPYKYAVDGTSGTLATLAGLSCASGCTVAIPAITQHVVYYQVILRDASNNILSTSATNVVAIP